MKLNKLFSHRVLVLIISILVFACFAFAASGDLDTSFLGSAGGITNGNVNVFKVQPDGKVLVGGLFIEANGVAQYGLLRLNSDGSRDSSFNTPDFFGNFGFGGIIDAIGLQSDGKILVGGRFNGVNGVYNPGIYRLNSNGSLDSTFTVPQLSGNNSVKDILVLPNNQFIVGGDFQFFFNANPVLNFVRFNADGAYDPTFAPPNRPIISKMHLTSNGKILAVTVPSNGSYPNKVSRFNLDGTIDNTYSPVTITNSNGSNGIFASGLQADGSLIIAGSFASLNGFTAGSIAKITPDGAIDLSFNQNNSGVSGIVNSLEIRSDGKILIVGPFNVYNGILRSGVALINADGTLNTTFIPPNFSQLEYYSFYAVTTLANNQVLVGTANFGSTLLKLNSGGSLDSAYSLPITRSGIVRKVLQQPDGKILFGGEFKFADNIPRNSLARVNADGTLDTTFQTNVIDAQNSQLKGVVALAIQPDGKILVGLRYNLTNVSRVYLLRLNPNGSQDTAFSSPISINDSSIINDISVLPNGQILVAGDLILIPTGNNRKLVRLNSNGTLDTTFDSVQANGEIKTFFVQPDGKIMIGGTFLQVASSVRGRIARLNSDGTVDTTFNPPGGANNTIWDLDVQPDGKVVLGGDFTGLNGNSSNQRIGRLNADGTLDTTFTQTANATILAVKVQPSGKILIGGGMSQIGSFFRTGLARLNTDGSFDLTFNTSVNSTVWDVTRQTDGKLLIGGEFTRINGISTVRIARLQDNTVTARPLFDFDGDGKADVSVYRASTNTWYRILSGNSSISQNNFGIANDIPVPADFDGDGKTDLAIFRPSTGTFWYQSSINNAQIANQWGQSGDIPRPSDFDGDGKADFIIFRPSENNWYRLGSTGQVSNKGFGAVGDKPVIGDFDGDGKSDVAIFRPSSGDWWYQSSINNAQLATHFGASTDIPSPADFDGDGKTDFAVFRPSTGVWYILNSSTGSATIVQFGIAEDKPVPADYDGDGKSDIAVFRPSTGLWYLLRSTSGFSALQFGISSDVPLPNSFVP
jgi:uncharacterized delta-60 repeat protein